MKNLFAILMLTICISVSLSAQKQQPARVPATPYPIEFTHPNGEKLTIRLFGDEWHHYNTTLDGFVIVQDKAGYYCYAKKEKNGKISATKHRAHNIGERGKCEQKFLKKQAKNPDFKKNITN
ncbi:MAG: hypothetical protein LBS50_11725 [Prevotellaceae bacterium]|jgi:hypothetical protein|nr:hypothetical protein [Prevotellaceae bacterium]